MASLDTSFLVDLLWGRKEAALLATKPITALELHRGAYFSADPERN